MTSIPLNKLNIKIVTNKLSGERYFKCEHDHIEYISDERYSDWAGVQLLICEAYKVKDKIVLVNGSDIIVKFIRLSHDECAKL